MSTRQIIGYRLAFIALAFHMLAWLLPVLPGAAASEFLQICTTQGLETVQLSDAGVTDSGDAPDKPGPKFEHCPFCSVHNASANVPVLPVMPVVYTQVDKHFETDDFSLWPALPYEYDRFSPRDPPASA